MPVDYIDLLAYKQDKDVKTGSVSAQNCSSSMNTIMKWRYGEVGTYAGQYRNKRQILTLKVG